MNNKIIAMIPARIGSTRLKMKNLALLNGKPMIYYAIKAAKDAKVFDKIVINSDSQIFKKIADRYGVDFYLRPKKLGGSEIKSDDVVFDFIKNHNSDIIVWVNSISPLQTSDDIKKTIQHFIKNKCNSLITVVERQAHCIYKKEPLNFKIKGKFEQTQDLIPLEEMVYSIMMWKSSSFINLMKKEGSAILHGKVAYYPINKLRSLIVKNQDDLLIVDSIMKINNDTDKIIKYDKICPK
jgi:CMP-N-acetylneuraminic acid synthetase